MAAKAESQKVILDAVAKFFVSNIADNSFNGISASQLLNGLDDAGLKAILHELVSNGSINCTFYDYDINIHIKRMPSPPVARQLAMLENHALNCIGCYPTEEIVSQHFDLNVLNDRPYSRKLAAGASQLDFVAFDFAALERYLNDPRFSTDFGDYGGNLSIRDDYYRKEGKSSRDNISIQTFGLGFAKDKNPVAIVFLRYLTNLNSAHQLYWKSYETGEPASMCYQYFQSSILGEFYENATHIYALKLCIDGVAELTTKIFGFPLFRESIPEDRPLELGVFMRPTKKAFQRFVISLDHFLSENINEKIFPPDVPRTEAKEVRGKQTEQKIGSLRLLELWLFSIYRFKDPDEARANLIEPLKQVRKLRQAPAHKTTGDEYDVLFYAQRKKLLAENIISLLSLIEMFERHPKGYSLKLPEWLREGRLDPW